MAAASTAGSVVQQACTAPLCAAQPVCHGTSRQLMRTSAGSVASPAKRYLALAVCARSGPPSRRLHKVHFQKSSGQLSMEAGPEQEEFIRLPVDSTELLGLSGRTHYLFCDVTGAYDELLSAQTEDGFSEAVLQGRRKLLELAKDTAIYREGRVAPEAEAGVMVPVNLLPSALLLLTQIGRNDLVVELAPPMLENWEVRKSFKRDILLSLALAHCGIARELLSSERTADGCAELEQALQLLRGAGSPALAPSLAAEIQGGLASLEVPRVLDQLRGPMGPEMALARKRAVKVLRGMLSSPVQVTSPDGQAINADYVRLTMSYMSADEVVEAADWAAVAKAPKSVPWTWPGGLTTAALAHAAAGFTQRQPALVKAAGQLLKGEPQTAEVVVARAMCELLLGSVEAAVALIRQAARAPVDELNPWPAAAGEDNTEDVVAGTALPGSQEVYAFVCSHSPDDERDLLPGLCLLAELWLSKVAFASFRFPDVPSSALTGYFNTLRVEQLLQQHEERSKAFVNQLAAACERMGGKLQQLADTGAKAVDGLGVHAGSSGAHNSPSKQWGARQGQGPEGALAQLQRLPDVAGALVRAGSAALPVQAGRATNRGTPTGVVTGLTQLRPRPAGVLVFGAAALLAVGLAARRFSVSGPFSRPVTGPQAAAQVAQQQPGSSSSSGGASRAAAVGTVMPSTARSPGAHAASAAVPIVRQLDRAGAEKLVRGWQEAKAAALGPNADASGLVSVLAEPMLEQVAAKAQRLVEQGWFYRYKLWGVRVERLEPAPGGRLTVHATLNESAALFGVDGREADSYHSEYGAEYSLVPCADGMWRIAACKVVGREPAEPRAASAEASGGVLGTVERTVGAWFGRGGGPSKG